jgi:hypothetical protein
MRIEYCANGRKRRITVRSLSDQPSAADRPMTFPFVPQAEGTEVIVRCRAAHLPARTAVRRSKMGQPWPSKAGG